MDFFPLLHRDIPLTEKQEQLRGDLETALEAWTFSLLQRNFEV